MNLAMTACSNTKPKRQLTFTSVTAIRLPASIKSLREVKTGGKESVAERARASLLERADVRTR